MFKNYIKLGFRNLIKNKLSSVINITGLGMAIGCCMVVFVYLDLWFNMDKFHSKLDRIFVVERMDENQRGKLEYHSSSPAPIGPLLKDKFPQIVNTARLHYTGALFKQGDHVIRETITFADYAFYDIFDFPLKWGNTNSFGDQNGIVLSEEFSSKLFEDQNPIGKTLNVILTNQGKEYKESFIVQGVFADKKVNASFHFSALIPFAKLVSFEFISPADWSKHVDITFLETQSKNSAVPTSIQSKEFLNIYNDANKDSKISSFHFQPLQGMQFHSYKLDYSRFANTHIIGVIMLISIAVGILLLAFFNYMNIAIASASGRLKEIGVRKVVGSGRKQIISQFLIENVVVVLAGVGFALILTKLLFLPWFSRLVAHDLSIGLFTNIRVWVALIFLALLSILGGAAYPSIYISSLKPVSIVRGKLILNNRNGFRKLLLGFQFFITFLGISMALAFVREYRLSKTKPWGYEPSYNVVVRLGGLKNYDLFKAELIKDKYTQAITGSVEAFGKGDKQILIKLNGQDQTVKSFNALGGFAGHFGIKILKGRDLNKNFEMDQSTAILVNQAFLKANQWTSAVGKSIEHNNKNYSIVGETNDFRYESFEYSIEPLVMMACKPEDVNYAYLKVSPGLISGAHRYIEGIWKTLFPDRPYDYYYQDNVFDNYYFGFTQVIQILSAASFIMVLVSVCGIFGLALLILSRKMKDLSIRKVLGAGYSSISMQIFKEFLAAISIAFLFGLPVSWLLTQAIFTQFTPESFVSFIPLIAGLLAIITMTLLSVSWHLYKAFTSNPIHSLRTE